MKIFYVEHMHMKDSHGITQGMIKAYRRVASEFASFNDRLTAEKLGKDVMNQQFVQTAVEFRPDFVYLGKCESLHGESVRLVKEATGATVVHFYSDYRRKVKLHVADVGRYADMTVLPYRDETLWVAHREAGCKRVEFWWHGTDPECYYPHSVPREYDVVFIANPRGNRANPPRGRIDLVNALADAGIDVHIFTTISWAKKGLKPHKNIHLHSFVDQEEFGLACSKGRIALGYSTNKVYMYTGVPRWLSSMASGAFFLGHWFPGVDKVFKTGKHLVWFKDIRGAVKLAQYYLAHEGKRERIAKAGRERVLKYHTWDHRVAQMMEYVKQIKG